MEAAQQSSPEETKIQEGNINVVTSQTLPAGYLRCERCDEIVHVNKGGRGNLVANHQRSKRCREIHEARSGIVVKHQLPVGYLQCEICGKIVNARKGGRGGLVANHQASTLCMQIAALRGMQKTKPMYLRLEQFITPERKPLSPLDCSLQECNKASVVGNDHPDVCTQPFETALPQCKVEAAYDEYFSRKITLSPAVFSPVETAAMEPTNPVITSSPEEPSTFQSYSTFPFRFPSRNSGQAATPEAVKIEDSSVESGWTVLSPISSPPQPIAKRRCEEIEGDASIKRARQTLSEEKCMGDTDCNK